MITCQGVFTGYITGRDDKVISAFIWWKYAGRRLPGASVNRRTITITPAKSWWNRVGYCWANWEYSRTARGSKAEYGPFNEEYDLDVAVLTW